MRDARKTLYLFSSDQSPLYAQDILNVLGMPDGQPYTFRYDERYLTHELRETWDGLQDRDVVVIFSLQQQALYHDAAFIPVRRGTVATVHREGTTRFVTFRVGAYASLPAPPVVDGREQPGDAVRAFTQCLRALTQTPYAASAGLGQPIPSGELAAESDPSLLFARVGSYLARTSAFANARFVRVLGLKLTGAADTKRLTASQADPVFVLDAGDTYDLELFHAQPAAPSAPEAFAVHVDGSAINTIGRAGFDVASRYDRVTVRLAATAANALEDRATVISVEPDEDVQGPVVRLDVRVRAGRGRAIGVATMQAVALVTVALAGALTMWPIGARIALAVVGALAAVALGLLGASALKTPPLPTAPKPAKP